MPLQEQAKDKKKARRTKTSASGLCDTATPHVKIKDSDDKDSEDDGDDSDQERNPTTSTQRKKSKKETPRKKKKGRRNPVVLRRGRIPGEAARVVLDGGTEFEVIGGVGWRVLERVSKSAKLHGWGGQYGWTYSSNCQCSHCL